MHGCIRSNAVKERCVLTIQEQKGVTSSGVSGTERRHLKWRLSFAEYTLLKPLYLFNFILATAR